MITVRPAKESDIIALAPIQLEVHAVHTSAFPWRYKELTSETLNGYVQFHLSNPESRVFVAQVDKSIVGYAVIATKKYSENDFLKPYECANLDQLAVLSSAQRKGIGAALLAACKDALPTLNQKRLELDVWNFSGNAADFFISQGFSAFNTKMSLVLDG